jgi:hypothetical protein
MKKLLLTILFTLVLSGGTIAKTSLENFSINKDNKINSKRNVNYFTNQGYEIVLQETNGTTTGYVLKKDEDYVGCRSVGLSQEQTCYIIVLKRVK